jgi:hypothetical protein
MMLDIYIYIYGGIVVWVERWMNDNNVIELWLLAFEYESCDNGYYEYLKKVSLGYVALALVYLFALRVCGFTGSVLKGKSMVCGSSTRVFVCLAGMWLYVRCCKR